MRRFFKSAAFPILLVVILAFVAQKVISNPSDDKAPSYNQLVSSKAQGGLIASGEVDKISINTKDNTLDVTLKGEKGEDGESFSCLLYTSPSPRD